MHRNQSRLPIRASILRTFMAPLLAAGINAGTAVTVHATAYQITDLVTDDPGAVASLGLPPATLTDPDLVNPWGISHGATPFWVSDNGTGLATLYNGAGGKLSPAGLPHVIVSPPASSSPTGTVFNGGTGFVLPGTALPARFIFATEQGTITGWNNALADPSHTALGIDNSASGAIYKGLAIARNASGTFLFAANFNTNA